MRRLATMMLTVLTATTLAGGPAAAQDRGGDGPRSRAVGTAKAASVPSVPALVRLELHGAVVTVGNITTGSASATVSATPTAGLTATPTVQLLVRRGSKAYRGTTVTVEVPGGTPVKLNGRRVTLAALTTGDRVEVKAVRRADGTITARRVEAQRKPVKPAKRAKAAKPVEVAPPV